MSQVGGCGWRVRLHHVEIFRRSIRSRAFLVLATIPAVQQHHSSAVTFFFGREMFTSFSLVSLARFRGR